MIDKIVESTKSQFLNENKKILITDTSVLINFLNINRLDLLFSFPGLFLITEHVVEKITDDFPLQQALLNLAVNKKELTVVKVDNEKELKIYNDLFEMGRLGSGECSAIACAINRSFYLVMEDVRACKEALKIAPDMIIFKTQDIMAKLIEDKILSITEANLIKQEWQTKYRFALKFNSFSDFLAEKEGLSYD